MCKKTRIKISKDFQKDRGKGRMRFAKIQGQRYGKVCKTPRTKIKMTFNKKRAVSYS